MLRGLSAVSEELERTPTDDFDTRQRLRKRQATLRARASELRARQDTSHAQKPGVTHPTPNHQVGWTVPGSPRVPVILILSQVVLIVFLLALIGLLIWGASNDWRLDAVSLAAGVLLIAAFFGVWLYFLPAGIAAERNAPNRGGVFAVNLLLGWTVIGWVVALAMAYSHPATHKWKRVRSQGWELVPRRGTTQSSNPPQDGHERALVAERPDDGPRPGQEAVIIASPAAVAWTGKDRIRRVGALPSGARVQVAALALGTEGWMSEVITTDGDRCWVDPGDLGDS